MFVPRECRASRPSLPAPTDPLSSSVTPPGDDTRALTQATRARSGGRRRALREPRRDGVAAAADLEATASCAPAFEDVKLASTPHVVEDDRRVRREPVREVLDGTGASVLILRSVRRRTVDHEKADVP